MLHRYILLNYIKVFVLTLTVLFGILYAYTVSEVLFIFKKQTTEVFVNYTLNFLSTAFFYTSAFISGISLLTVYRSLTRKKIDLLTQSFGISPLKFSFSILLFSFFISLLNLLGSYEFFSNSHKELYKIEREYRKAKEIESGVVRNLWLKEETSGEVRFYNFGIVETSSGNIYKFYLLKVKAGSISEVITAESGLWQGSSIRLSEAKISNLFTGEESIKELTIEYLPITQIKPLSEKPEHLSLRHVLTLSIVGERAGINQRLYIYETLKRVFTAFLPLFTGIILSWVYIRWRQFNLSAFALLSVFASHWLFLNLIRSLLENTDINLLLASLIYTPIPALALRGLYDLGKGFRV
ncbi:MAG: LptF/LptG family permease [Aquificaceae bacterium]|nr:LptF/LptG family permease [Aquificaceae bacterium]